MDQRQLKTALDALASRCPAVDAALREAGYPEPRRNPPGYATLLRTLVHQQLSIKAAATIHARLCATVGNIDDPAALLAQTDVALRAAGLSARKVSYARSLAHEVHSRALDLSGLGKLPVDAAIAALTKVRGIGRWSAEIYLLFAAGQPDVWPAGDLALQEGMRRLLGLAERPGEKQLRHIGLDYAPHRGALAKFIWHYYATGASQA